MTHQGNKYLFTSMISSSPFASTATFVDCTTASLLLKVGDSSQYKVDEKPTSRSTSILHHCVCCVGVSSSILTKIATLSFNHATT